MAAHTSSGGQSTAVVRRVEKGAFIIDSGNHAFAATTFSTSDTLHCLHLAQGITVWAWWAKFFNVEASGEFLLRIGTTDLSTSCTVSASVTMIVGAGNFALNAGAHALALPYRVSLSDDAATLYETLKVVRLAGTITTSDMVRVWVLCSMDTTHDI